MYTVIRVTDGFDVPGWNVACPGDKLIETLPSAIRLANKLTKRGIKIAGIAFIDQSDRPDRISWYMVYVDRKTGNDLEEHNLQLLERH